MKRGAIRKGKSAMVEIKSLEPGDRIEFLGLTRRPRAVAIDEIGVDNSRSRASKDNWTG
jgi:hypothetical protein